MKRTTVVSLLVAAVLAISGVAYLTLGPGLPLDHAPQTASAPQPAAAPPAAPAPTSAPAPAASPASVAPAPAAPAPASAASAFIYRRLSIDGSRDLTEACFAFSQRLNDTGSVRYDDYVRVRPATRVAMRVAGDRLCLGGLAFGRDYDVELMAGLPAADGATLAVAETVKVAMGERPPVVAFTGSGMILPRETAAGVPLTTVNVEAVSIKVLRVPDRLIARGVRGIADEPLARGRRAAGYRRACLAGHDAGQRRAERDRHHRLPDPRGGEALEARCLSGHGVECRRRTDRGRQGPSRLQLPLRDRLAMGDRFRYRHDGSVWHRRPARLRPLPRLGSAARQPDPDAGRAAKLLVVARAPAPTAMPPLPRACCAAAAATRLSR